MNVRFFTSLALLFVLMAAPGCLYSRIRTPLDRDLHVTELGTKTGEASWKGFVWAVAVGDAGIQAAAEDGGIAVIRHADREILSVLFGLYVRQTTIVYGD